MPTTTTAPTTCTVVVAAPMIRCGAPAVTTLKGRGGVLFAECAEHDMGHVVAEPTGPVVGATVTIVHAGLAKVGTVVKVGRTLAHVEVATPHGKGATLVVPVPLAGLVVA